MKKDHYPFLATIFGLGMLLIVTFAVRTNGGGEPALPLLTLLAICEVSFFATAIGAVLGFRRLGTAGREPKLLAASIACVLLALRFAIYLVQLWPL